MKKNEWITIIVLMVVIAAVVALITGSITGNAIWGASKGNTNTAVTYQGVLNMFRDKCILTNPDLYIQDSQYKIYWVCEKYNAQYGKSTTCVFADNFNNGKTQILTCDSVLTAGLNSSSGLTHVMCCAP